ncbi:MAG: hypothetical protein LUQ57_05965 [Methylococcaceae bacterium]|nr:hypothetical protein [Methylococcaceae bacterium]
MFFGIIGVILDKLQNQRISLTLMPVNRKQQPVALIQPGPVQIVADFFDLGRFEVIGFEILDQLGKAGNLFGVQFVVKKNPH